MSLIEYARKRDFRRTAEPRPRRIRAGPGLRFVVQKHAASRLHYDLRLELGGTLKSWAVPKGIPLILGEKHLAVEVEDHPVSYIDFEGTIPKGQYGGGTVMVWDQGTYEAVSPDPTPDLARGKLHFNLQGRKLRGAWYLVRIAAEKNWLLIRGGEDHSPISKRLYETSALTGRSMTAIARNGDAPASVRIPRNRLRRGISEPRREKRSKAEGVPSFIEPMKARLVESPPPGEWIYEIKFDGYRAEALLSGGDARIFSRNRKDFTPRFPEVVEALARLPVADAVIDGEIVALDDEGRSSFQLLQAPELGTAPLPIFYYAFDLLRLDGADLRKRPLTERKAALERILSKAAGTVRYSASIGVNADALLTLVRQRGLEGLVGKRMDSVYESGRRTGAWVKLRVHQQQEMVIGGYTDPAGSRKDLGALLVGHYDGNRLKFAGKVGTGFDSRLLHNLHDRFRRIATPQCPFSNLPESRRGRFGQSFGVAQMERCHWVRPELVCQLRFTEWTRDGKLRHPVFVGMRDDKEPREVVAEES